MNRLKTARRVVFKVGTSSLTYETGLINIRKIESLCRTLSDVKNSGREVILVSSGAIAVGLAKLGVSRAGRSIPEKQAAAAVGQCELMYIYDKHFTEYHHKLAQVLLTREDIEASGRRKNIENTFEALIKMGALPIVNENDTVATEEIAVGDNDTLSAVVAELTHADALIILSDVDGLYDKNPGEAGAKLIPRVTKIDAETERIAGGAGSARGTGGMATKISAARICELDGIPMAIISGDDMNNIYALLAGEQAGTIFGEGD